MPDGQPRYKRILLKLSGEAGVGGDGFGIDPKTLAAVSEEIAQVVNAGIQVCVVVGGGNIFRGAALAEAGMERASADYMGMLATVMNALAVQAALEKIGVFTRVQSAIPMEAVCEPYIRRRRRRPVLHDRLRRGAACGRDGLRRALQGHQRRRRLYRRPQEGSGRQ